MKKNFQIWDSGWVKLSASRLQAEERWRRKRRRRGGGWRRRRRRGAAARSAAAAAEVMGYCWRPRSSSDQPDAAAKIDKKYFVVRLVNLLATKGALCLTPPSRLPCYVFSVFVC